MTPDPLLRRLLRAQLLMAWNAATATAARRGATIIVSVLVAGAVLAGWRAATAAFATAAPVPAEVETAIARMSGALVAFTLVTGVTFALGALYFARDLEALHASPMRPGSIIAARVCVQLVTGLGIGGLFLVPPLAAWLDTRHTLWSLPGIAVVVAALAAIPLLLGTAAAVAVVRAVPAARIRDAAGILATLAFVVSVGTNLAIRGPAGFTSGLPSDQFLGRATTPLDAAWLPTGWAARACVALAEGNAGRGALWALPLLAGAALLAAVVPRLCAGWYVSGWQSGREASRGSGRRRVRARSAARPPVWAVIALKDVRSLRGDGQQIAQLLLPVLMFGVYMATPGTFGAPRLPFWYGTGLTACFAGMFISSGMALRGVGMEGRSWWLIKAAPVGAGQVLAAKLVAGFAVAGAFSTLLFILGDLRSGEVPLNLGLLDVGIVTLGLCAIAVGVGATRPRMDWTDPRRSVGLATSMAYLLLGGGYLLTAFTVLALPYALDGTAPLVAAGQGALSLITLAAVAAALVTARARLGALDA